MKPASAKYLLHLLGQLVMAFDYSQIELRAVGELISDWFGYDSILRQSFAAGMDAHIATAMSDDRQKSPGGCH